MTAETSIESAALNDDELIARYVEADRLFACPLHRRFVQWQTFDLAAVDAFLATWQWHRTADQHGTQIGFGHRNYSLGTTNRGKTVALRFVPASP